MPQLEMLSINDIQLPQHEIIHLLWLEFQTLVFSEALSGWLTQSLFLRQSHACPIHVWLNMKGRWELLAGFRTYNLAQALSLPMVCVVKHENLSSVDALKLALLNTIEPFLIWNLKGEKSGKQVSGLCARLRKALPSEMRSHVPRPSEIKKWLEISANIGRIKEIPSSRLEGYRSRIAISQEAKEAETK